MSDAVGTQKCLWTDRVEFLPVIVEEVIVGLQVAFEARRLQNCPPMASYWGEQSHILSFFFLINLFYFIYFIFGCIGSSLLRMGFSLVLASGSYSSLWCVGFSLQWLLLLQSTGSRRAGFSSYGSQALECRLSSCGAQA